MIPFNWLKPNGNLFFTKSNKFEVINMDKIKTQIIDKQLEIAGKLLELADYFQRKADSRLNLMEKDLDLAETVESRDTEFHDWLIEECELSSLEAEEDAQLSIVLSKKAMKFIEEVNILTGD